MLLIWVGIFIFSLFLLVKGSDWLLDSSSKIGYSFGLSPFTIGVVIVGIGTSLPELVSSMVAVFKGVPDFVVANAAGSNIANILLVVGLAVIVAKKLQVTKNLIDLDLPLVAGATAIFAFVAMDGQITFFESLFLVFAYFVYLIFSIIQREEVDTKEVKVSKVGSSDILFLVLGIVGIALGSKYLIDSVIVLSETLNIAPGVIAITAVALGTSAPELVVSLKAAFRKQSEMALGNIFGSNVFNVLMVVGIPGLFMTLPIDSKTFTIGLPALGLATLLFVISGISKRIHLQEGAMFLILYVLFIGKLFDLF